MGLTGDPVLDFLGIDPDQPEEWELHEPTLPEVPADLLDAPPWDEEPCACECCDPEPFVAPALSRSGASEGSIARFSLHFRESQRQKALMWRAIAAIVESTGTERVEFVADDLALVAGVHPRTTQPWVGIALDAVSIPALMTAMETGEICDRHVHALLDEASSWTADSETARRVVELTVERCRSRVEQGLGWPTPAQLRRRVRTSAMLMDLTAAERAKKNAVDRRGVSLRATGVSSGEVVIQGPDVTVARIMECIRARAEAMRRMGGNGRTLDQLMHDAAYELLTVDGEGGESQVPTFGEGAEAVTIRVGGADVSVIVPFSVGVGGDLEVAEIPGYGPILPSTAREILAAQDSVRRVAVDADTGRIIAIDDNITGSARRRDPDEPGGPGDPDDTSGPDELGGLGGPGGPGDPDELGGPGGPGGPGDPDEPGDPDGRGGGPPPRHDDDSDPVGPARPEPPQVDEAPDGPADAPADGPDGAADAPDGPADPPADAPDGPADPPADAPARGTAELLERLVTKEVILRDLSTPSYRVPGRLRRRIEMRDRTCQFPGCTLPGRWCDVDHRDAWPHGETSEQNLHCLCRRHHRAKQVYFELEVERDGTTVWITPDGRRYRTPAPFF